MVNDSKKRRGRKRKGGYLYSSINYDDASRWRRSVSSVIPLGNLLITRARQASTSLGWYWFDDPPIILYLPHRITRRYPARARSVLVTIPLPCDWIPFLQLVSLARYFTTPLHFPTKSVSSCLGSHHRVPKLQLRNQHPITTTHLALRHISFHFSTSNFFSTRMIKHWNNSFTHLHAYGWSCPGWSDLIGNLQREPSPFPLVFLPGTLSVPPSIQDRFGGKRKARFLLVHFGLGSPWPPEYVLQTSKCIITRGNHQQFLCSDRFALNVMIATTDLFRVLDVNPTIIEVSRNVDMTYLTSTWGREGGSAFLLFMWSFD
jgi:hypothetical protein